MVIALVIGIIQIILFLGHFVVYKTVVQFLHITSPQALLWTRVVFIVLSVSFVLASLVAFRWYGPWVRALYIPAAVWLGTLYWLFLASLLAWTTHWLARASSANLNTGAVGIGLLALAVIISTYGVWNSYQTRVRHITVRIDNLPQSWQGRRAVLVADTHLGNFRNTRFSVKVAALIKQQQPDIVFIPGDFYDGTPEDYTRLAQAFGSISAPLGVFLAPGNHEEFGDANPLFKALRNAGITVLDNKLELVDGVQIIGVAYAATTTDQNQHAVLENLSPNQELPSILIKHAPTLIASAQEAGIDFQVSGHTHLGQVYPIKYITKALYGQFYYGLTKLDTTQVLTTSGVGTWGPPQRVGADPEIVVITFE